MIFSSFVFLFFFFIITVGLYYILPKFLRNFLLVVTSLVFYAWGEPIYVLIMIFSILFNWIIGLCLEKVKTNNKKKSEEAIANFQESNKHSIAEKILIIICCVVNLGALSFFKYTNFFIENINSLTSFSIELFEIVLPIGISFYTFQTLSYVIDVYWGNVKVQKNLIDFATFVTMFPQLIAGPIVRYSDVEKQLKVRNETSEMVANGILRFIIGLGKKVLLANKAGAIWDMVYSEIGGGINVSLAWIGAIAFSFQIYFDFSGYSDMAIGLGKMFGFEFPENFNYPYISSSITEFWRRWHITLSSWFREYVYIPLGGNRKGKGRQILNLLIVWCLTGFWHGASWNFILWGFYFFVLLMIEKLFLLKLFKKIPKLITHIYSLFFIIIGWVIFSCTKLSEIGTYLKSMFSGPLVSSKSMYILSTNAILFIIMIVAATPLPKIFFNYLSKKMNMSEGLCFAFKATTCMFIFILCIAYLTGDSYNPFLYFRF